MYAYSTQIRVRYGETDQMGYLYYGNYALYYEVGRTDAIRNLGLTYKAMEAQGIALPVAECHLQYLRPAYYDDLLEVKTSIRELPTDSFIEFHTEIFNDKNKLINKGRTRLAFYDIAARKKAPMPEFLLEKLRPFFSEQ